MQPLTQCLFPICEMLHFTSRDLRYFTKRGMRHFTNRNMYHFTQWIYRILKPTFSFATEPIRAKINLSKKLIIFRLKSMHKLLELTKYVSM